jgi:hypothetical protein
MILWLARIMKTKQQNWTRNHELSPGIAAWNELVEAICEQREWDAHARAT